MPLPLTWLDNSKTYDFLTSLHKIPRLRSPGQIMPYALPPSLKTKFDLLSPSYGYEYSQQLYHFYLALNSFIRLNIPVNRLSLLVNETFYYFERYFYMKLNWEKGKPGYYRDHSLHAANEAFLGYKLLDNIKPIKQEMMAYLKGDNKTTRYINNACQTGISDKVLEHVIYTWWFIASLFHDLGYVLSFNRELRQSLLTFHRHSDLILKTERSSFDAIQLLIGNSMLFNTVDPKELEHSYDSNKHGTLSAFLLLATFYSPPAFDGVETIDRVAIELAAQSIYYHDSPEENKPAFVVTKPSHTPLKRYGCYEKYFIDVNATDLDHFINARKMYKSKVLKIKLPDSDSQGSNRKLFNEDPFQFFLRCIDELQGFGRNYLSFGSGIKKKLPDESRFSYPVSLRNLVRFPAQALECSDDKTLRVFFLADASLFYEKAPTKVNTVSYYDDSHSVWNESAVEHFLAELFWLDKSISDSKNFPNLDLYFVEIWG
ncbi:MAG: hypothetical protein GY795_49815 [Desulfobacterales bacterium]|nr:hypothetical protein [Desulfobacterales bacterium]